MSASVKQQIEALSSVDPADAARINSAITHSEFSKAKKEELALAVLRQVSKAVDDEDPSKGQVLMHPYNYATHSDLEYFKDLSKSNQQCAVRLRSRLKLVECTKPSEKSFGAMAAFLAALREPDMTSVSLHFLVLDLKSAMSAPPGPSPACLHSYPVSPNSLPRAVFQKAYAEEPPAPVELATFKDIYGRCPQRKSHKALRSAPAASQQSLVPAVSAGLSDNSIVQVLSGFAAKWMSSAAEGMTVERRSEQQPRGDADLVMPDMPQSSQGQLVQTDRRLQSNLGPAEQPPAPITSGQGETAQDEEEDQENPDDVVAHLEQQAALTLKKRPAGSLKRPAAAKSHSKPKPAAAAAASGKSKKASGKPKKASKASGGAVRVLPGKPCFKPGKPCWLPGKQGQSTAKRSRLGCSRCRGNRAGCSVCRNPAFAGRRFQGYHISFFAHFFRMGSHAATYEGYRMSCVGAMRTDITCTREL